MKPLALIASFALVAVSMAGQNDPLPRKGWFGAGFAPITPEIRAERKLPATGGLLIAQIVPGASAEGAGLRPQDVVLKIDGMSIDAPPAVVQAVSKRAAGQTVKVEILRDGKPQTLDLVLKPRPADKGENYETLYEHAVTNGDRIRMFVTRPTHVQGKRPVLFFIQGIGYVSAEQPLSAPGSYSRICKAFNDKGFVTVRVEKPGLGDSEGGPADQVDFDREVDAFRQALKKTMAYDFVDKDNVFIFGHSMGGCEGPILAGEFPIKGIAVYGTGVKTWHEYMLENVRRQRMLRGASAAEVDRDMRQMVTALHLLFNEKLTPAQAIAKYPQYKEAVDQFSPDGKTMSGIGFAFWPGVFAQNYPAHWERANGRVLSIWGESEFIASRDDHPLIAQIVNAKRPGTAKFVTIPRSDHGFRNVADPKESQDTWGQPGKPFNPAIIDVLTGWVEEVMKGV